ncbi:MAG: aldose 1-epimerase family protein [Acidimicrobiales bacterium]
MHDGPEGAATGTVPSGRQFSISHGDATAIVTEVGAGLRELSVAGDAVVWGYPLSEMAGGGRGQLLAPWPNRLEDGTYRFAGLTAHAALDEPDRRNAIHGLVRWLVWSLRDEAADRLTLSCELAPQPAYPWRLALEVTYVLGSDGLVVQATAQNRSSTAAPFGMGFHPYLAAGPLGADGCSLRLGARRHLLCDERGLPCGSASVEGGPYDFSSGRSLAGVHLDDCFTDMAATPDEERPDGSAWHVTLSRPDGSRCTLWADSAWPYVMIYTGDTLAPEDRRRGVAVEPMTCPPNALRSGDSIVTLAAGGRWSGRFGIRALF